MTDPAKAGLLQHFLAALAYRTQKALRDAPPTFADFRVAANVRTPHELILQGPLADAMTHVGQLAMLRRLHASPVPPENFLLADIQAANLGPEQAPPRAPKQGWRPDQPPPLPGRPLV